MSDDKTEPATPRKRKKAREEGQVARSSELISSVILLTMLMGSRSTIPQVGEAVTSFFMSCFSAAGPSTSPEKLQELAGACFRQTGQLAFPAMGLAMVMGVGVNILQVGLSFTPKLLEMRGNRIALLQGMKRLFAPQGGMEIFKGLLKVGLVGFTGWRFLSQRKEQFFRFIEDDPSKISSQVGILAYDLGMQMVGTLMVVAALDYAYQRFQLERSLRMTKQEVKDELRDSEGNPETRGRIRQRQREFAGRRMMAEVPTATVVITNPTHYAVALRYKVGQPGAPRVIAKGKDRIALRIRELAKDSRVPVIENPPLARALHAQAEIGQEIPAELYRAVAEVLALIWRLNQAQTPVTPVERREN